MRELSKQYDPKQVEDHIYKDWVERNYFHAVVDDGKTPYTIVMPPPNITGQLHMGHALDLTLQDCLIRLKRMQGFSALWLPGTDHASIATEARIVETMRQEGLTKEDLGREGFLERAWKWKELYGGRIVEQLKKLGASCDWQRERFTMDEGCSEAVVEVFIGLYKKGLIYRGERMVNWCPHCLTSISDAEVEFEEKEGCFWHIKYPLADGSGYLKVATTRPETMLGDTALAVHPDDERYRQYIGKTAILPLMEREIPIVADHYVDMEFGTGVVKITPAHDPNDFEVGARHGLPIVNIFNEDATINKNGSKYAGLTREEARKAVAQDLESGGYLLETEPITHNVGHCYRCDTAIEPRLSLQWFVKMKPLAEPAIQAVETGDIRFVPERFEKMYFNWMNNIRDWCISRQLWWGHRIPAWYCVCGEVIVAKTAPDRCPECGSRDLRQDEDTLDTWFSSALWPFSTLGWPDDTEDYRYFYPTNTLVTAYDIIFFWVARMIFSGLEQTGKRPFDTVFLHGIVRAEDGQKMSKSLGNGIDPLEFIEEFGADALRMTLAVGVSPGNDMRFSMDKARAYRNFANKLWNAARFILMNDVGAVAPDTLPDTLNMADRWLLAQLNRLVGEVTDNMERFELGVAAGKIYEFTWDIFCDWYIELAKLRLTGENAQEASACKQVLVYAMTAILKLLHPFMPFITEEIYLALPHGEESIMISAWPEKRGDLVFEQEEADFGKIMDVVRQIRVMRGEMNVPPAKKTSVYIETPFIEVFEKGEEYVRRLASAQSVQIGGRFDVDGAVQLATDSARILIPMQDLVDRDRELARLGRELEAAQKEIATLEARLANEQFTTKAPAQVVAQERDKLQKAKDKLCHIEQSVKALD